MESRNFMKMCRMHDELVTCSRWPAKRRCTWNRLSLDVSVFQCLASCLVNLFDALQCCSTAGHKTRKPEHGTSFRSRFVTRRQTATHSASDRQTERARKLQDKRKIEKIGKSSEKSMRRCVASTLQIFTAPLACGKTGFFSTRFWCLGASVPIGSAISYSCCNCCHCFI